MKGGFFFPIVFSFFLSFTGDNYACLLVHTFIWISLVSIVSHGHAQFQGRLEKYWLFSRSHQETKKMGTAGELPKHKNLQ